MIYHCVVAQTLNKGSLCIIKQSHLILNVMGKYFIKNKTDPCTTNSNSMISIVFLENNFRMQEFLDCLSGSLKTMVLFIPYQCQAF